MDNSWSSFGAAFQNHPNMPFYFLLLRFWVVLGETEYALRAFSAFVGVITIPVVFILGRRLFNEKVGLIAAILLSLNAWHIRYSEEVAGYSLLTLLVTISGMAWLTAIEHPSWKIWAGYVAVTTAAIYTHHFAILAPMAFVCSLLFLPRRAIPWKMLLVSGASVGVLIAPLLLAGWLARGVFVGVPPLTVSRIHQFLWDFTGVGGNILLGTYLLPLTLASIVGIREWVSHRASYESWKYGFLLAWLLIPFVVPSVFSLMRPVLNPESTDRGRVATGRIGKEVLL